tara:strand:- start:302 stop:1123 length:822 start_codon:yes stop_codon:yes gene_type:complete
MDRTFKTSNRIFIILLLSLSIGNTQAQDDNQTKPGFLMGAIGDSITSGVNANGVGIHKHFSWSTGKGTSTRSFQSHYKKIELMKKTEVKAYNMAKGGARSKDLPKQAIKLAKKKVDYATILIGANNLCDWKTSNQQQLDQFEKDVRTSINTLLESNRNIKIFLAPVPDMYNLWWINRNNNKCTKMWDTFNICSSILSSSLTDEQREEFKQRWEDLNRTLERISYDYMKNIKFDLGISYTRFQRKHISTVDCFHPSLEGQELISKKAWDNGWFN